MRVIFEGNAKEFAALAGEAQTWRKEDYSSDDMVKGLGLLVKGLEAGMLTIQFPDKYEQDALKEHQSD